MSSTVHCIFWKRYVDDILCAIPGDMIEDMLTHINSVNNNIQFTYEQEVESLISFLDVRITHEQDGSLSTSVYRKPTHTNQYLHFSSHHPRAHKPSVVSTLLKRASRYCSTKEQADEERQKVYNALELNGYPKRFIASRTLTSTKPEVKERSENGSPVSLTFRVSLRQTHDCSQTLRYRYALSQ